MRSGRGEAALVLGERVGVERVLARQVLRMDEGVRAGDPGAERGGRLASRRPRRHRRGSSRTR